MKVRAAVFLGLGLALVLVVAAVVLGGLPGKTGNIRAAGVPSETAAGTPSAGREGALSTQSPKPFALPSSLPPPAQSPLVSAPLPKTASARGKIVDGFPTAVIRPVPGSTVGFSSVTSGGGRLQVGLEGSSSMTQSALLDFYQGTLGTLGLRPAPATAPPGARALTFRRGPDAVTVTVSSSKRSSSYTVFGVFVASS